MTRLSETDVLNLAGCILETSKGKVPMEFLNPFAIFALTKQAWSQYRMWKILRYAPSAKKISLIVSVSQADFEKIPDALKQDNYFFRQGRCLSTGSAAAR